LPLGRENVVARRGEDASNATAGWMRSLRGARDFHA